MMKLNFELHRGGLALCFFATVGFAQTLTPLTPSQPPNSGGSVFVDDVARGQVVLFGGATISGPATADTWTLQGEVWTKLSPATQPAARQGAIGVYDSLRQRVVMFGGVTGETLMWSWDGGTWSSQTPAAWPTTVSSSAAAYDPGRDRIVLYGGQLSGSSESNQTWEFDGTNWALATPTATPPGLRSAEMTYDPTSARVLLFAGRDSSNNFNQTVYAYDGGTWVSAGSPTPGVGPVFWDPQLREILLEDDTGRIYAFDGGFSQVASFSGKQPYGTYDSRIGAALFLGQPQAGMPLDAWTYDDAGIHAFAPPLQPGAQSNAGLFFDPVSQRPIFFGNTQTNSLPQTWFFDGAYWQLQLNTAPIDSWAAYDGFHGVELVSNFGVTAIYDAGTWETLNPAHQPVHYDAPFACDPQHPRCVRFGGTDTSSNTYAETWVWNGTDWTPVMPATSPPPRYLGAMAYDEFLQQFVLFGGEEGSPLRLSNDTWLYDGTNWAPVTGAAPPAMNNPSMAYDRGRGRVVLWGQPQSQNAPLWEFDGAQWLKITVDAGVLPLSGDNGLLAYDPVLGGVILFGPRMASTEPPGSADTWLYRGVGGPAQVDGGADSGVGPGSDGGVPGTDGGSGGNPGGSGGHGGCGCSAGPAGSLALLALVALRRRRPTKAAATTKRAARS